MREVLQLKLRCVVCGSETTIAVLPWPVRGARGEGILGCARCDAGHNPSNRFEAYLVKALVPAVEP